jgi:Dolichyl-phosphate-mannose-protein mannosyltransferase
MGDGTATQFQSDRSVSTAFVRRPHVQEYFWVAAIATVYLYLFVRVQWRIGDEGDMLNGALAVTQGRVPYRDFYDLRGPLSFYWLGLFFKTFGATWQVARLHLLLTGTLTSLLVYHLTRRVSRGAGALLPCALVTVLSIPSWAASHHHWDSNLFALAATAAFFYWQDHGRSRWLFATGVLAGLTSCFIYQKGGLLLASFVVVMGVSRLYFQTPVNLVRGICTMLVGYGVVGLVVLAWFFRLGALHDFFDATIRWPLNTYADANRLPYAYHLMLNALGVAPLELFPRPVALAVAVVLTVPFLLIAALPFLVVFLLGGRVLTAPAATVFRLPIVAYCLVGFALWFSEFHRQDVMHLIYGCPVLLIALWLLWDSVDRRRIVRIGVPAMVAISLICVATNRALYAASANEHVLTRRGAIVLPQDDPALRFLLSDDVARGDYVFVYPYYSTYYFLADVRNPTRFGEIMYGPGSKPHFDEAIAAIDAKQVKYVLWDTVVADDNLKKWFPAYQQPPENERWMERYLQTHYEQFAVLNGFRILRRRP